jgi:hypothetical protein
MPALPENPFAVLTLIAAPAILTNASSILILSTSNRFARAIDRARTISNMLESGKLSTDDPIVQMRIRHLERLDVRARMLLRATQLFYVSLGAFVSASLISVIGAGLTKMVDPTVLFIILAVAAVAGIIGVSALVGGCLMLVRETRIALDTLNEESEALRKKYQIGGAP